MKLPIRTKQKKAESESYAILLYKLRRLGIFRNLTESDYGIDFEVEVILDETVTGRYIKAQVKSAEKIFVRASDNVPTVGGIKQSTLAYWCELSYRTHVVAYAVDLTNELVYVSNPVFWQATKLIDESGKSKSIEFIPATKKIPQDTLVEVMSVANALSYSVPDTIYALTVAFRYLEQFFQLRVDAFHYDAGTELEHPEVFRAFLEVCSILLAWNKDNANLPKADKKHMFSYDHWARKWGASTADITCFGARAPMKALLPMLVDKLNFYKTAILSGVYYWNSKNPQFLKLAYNTPLPTATDDKTFDDWGYRYQQVSRRPIEPVEMLLHRMRQASKANKDGTKKPKNKKPG